MDTDFSGLSLAFASPATRILLFLGLDGQLGSTLGRMKDTVLGFGFGGTTLLSVTPEHPWR